MPVLMVNDIPVIDLFAGAGGLGIGSFMAGGSVRLSIEIDPVACETLRANPDWHKGTVIEGDVTQLTGQTIRRKAGLKKGDPLIIVGGPPCQPFSKASYWTDPGDESRYRQARARGERARKPVRPLRAKPDNRRDLIQHFWRIVNETRADAFLFENVPSILHPRNVEVFNNLKRAAESSGYLTSFTKALAVEYGVPQKRERVFLIGMRKQRPRLPEPTHHKTPGKNSTRRPPMSCGEALAPYSGDEFFEPEEVIKGRWAEHLRTVPPGMNYKAHTAWAGHPNPTFVTETRFWSFLLKLHPEWPSWTVAATPGPWTGPFHWDSRRLRTPEFAALQSFPHGYKFSGNRRERVRQVGNAVPPVLAAKMLKPVIDEITGRG